MDYFEPLKETYKNSYNYLKDISNIKEKWAKCYKPIIFNVGANTTSRSESMNALVKKYIGKQSELSAMIELIADLDQTSAFKVKRPKVSEEKEPILNSIKDKLGELIYLKHCH